LATPVAFGAAAIRLRARTIVENLLTGFSLYIKSTLRGG